MKANSYVFAVIFSFLIHPPIYGANLVLESPAFEADKTIPTQYTCDGKDVSPPLKWGPEPVGTKSFAISLTDPDAPKGTWVHWFVYNLPPGVLSAPEGMPQRDELFLGERQGMNDFGNHGYGGPCPPEREHRYYFRVYALDTRLDLEPDAKLADLEAAMEDHIIAKGELMGRYKRS